MKSIRNYLLKVHSDNKVEGILNENCRRISEIDKTRIQLAKAYAKAVEFDVLDYKYLQHESRNAFQELGQHLYSILFPDKISGHFYEHVLRELANISDVYVRLQLIFLQTVSDEIVNLPWEFLYHRETERFLATHPQIMLSYKYDDSLVDTIPSLKKYLFNFKQIFMIQSSKKFILYV